MDKKFSNGGLIKRGDEVVPVMMQPGVAYVPSAAIEKYGEDFLKRINGSKETIIIELEEPQGEP